MTEQSTPVVTAMKCAVCGAVVDIGTPMSFVCPNSSMTDRHHVLRFVSDAVPFRPVTHANPFVSYRRYLAVDAFGAAIGLDDHERLAIIVDADSSVARVAGTGFLRTPLSRQDHLSDGLGFTAGGGVWVKDETRNVAGSHKARHLFTELIHLLMAERAGLTPWSAPGDRPPLAIASCGNAAIAASTLAKAMDWPIAVHVPTFAEDSVMSTLSDLDADVRVCERRGTDPTGDPCVFRFREAVAEGAIPFGVQGTENAWCLDGGRTIGWEIIESMGHDVDRIVIQVGGGAFAACVGASLQQSGIHPRLHAVQAEGCAPLERAWRHAMASGGVHEVGKRWAECMWPWESEPASLADGILDDETYDWIGVVESMAATGGSPIVAAESDVVRAFRMARELTDIPVSPTGAAGLAGVLAARSTIADDERVVVVFSGVAR